MRFNRDLVRLPGPLLIKVGLIVLAFFCALGAVRYEMLGRIGHVSLMSDQARNQWLDSVRYLGDLNHRISDLRSAEAEMLLSHVQTTGDASGSPAIDAALDAVRAGVDRYRGVRHDANELAALESFLRLWSRHLADWSRVTAALKAGARDEAVSIFTGEAARSFDKARDAMFQLSVSTEERAKAARDRVAAAFKETERWLSTLSFGILILFVVLAAYLWLAVSRPLFRLKQLMLRLAGQETNFAVPFVRRRDEIGDMARSLAVFRCNTIELLESRKLLADQAEALSRSLAEARAIAKDQRNFITTISHEFRTPLNAIDGNAQRLIARKERADPSEIADRAGKIRAAVFRMTSLVGSLVNAMEVARGEMRARAVPFNPSAMLSGLAAYYRDIGIGSVEEDIADLPAEAVGDPELLNQAVSNLLSNAFKYSPEGAQVRLSASASGSALHVTVEDKGLGIPPEELGHVRERYFRASNVGTLSGTGMGLHLVDEIVRQHGGKLDIRSQEGSGTSVSITLPNAFRDNSQEQSRGHDPMRRGRPGDSGSLVRSAGRTRTRRRGSE